MTSPYQYYHSANGDTWNNNGPWSFTIDRESAVEVEVADDDDILQDDAPYGADGKWSVHSQLFSDAQPEASPFADWAGENIQNEYEITVQAEVDGVVTTYTMVAISAGDNDSNVVGFTFEGAWPPSGTSLTYVVNTNRDVDFLGVEDMLVPCFAAGTMLATPHGEVAIEDLREGDLVLTRDHGAQPIRWIGKTVIGAARLAVSPQLRPIRIKAGALGDNSPATDLVVSPQHRVLVRSKIAQRMFGTSEILVAARQLLQLDGIDIAGDLAGVEYFHMLFDRHEVVVSNGAETESLFTGPQALKALGRAARDEIFAIFPELRDAGAVIEAARPMVSGRKGRKLALRHAQAGRALVA